MNQPLGKVSAFYPLYLLEYLYEGNLKVRAHEGHLIISILIVYLNMLTKEKVINAISQLPGEFSVDQAIDELILLEKIDRGLAQSEANEVIPDEELDKELPEWLR